jgi:preprotein translocase subunit SecE
MMQRKWTHMMFAVGGVILAWILTKTGDWIWSYFAKPNSFAIGTGAMIVAGLATLIAWRNEPLFELANEVTTELSKVTWPTRKQTVHSTIVVIITTVISAGFLGMFDGIWSWVSRLIYQ